MSGAERGMSKTHCDYGSRLSVCDPTKMVGVDFKTQTRKATCQEPTTTCVAQMVVGVNDLAPV